MPGHIPRPPIFMVTSAKFTRGYFASIFNIQYLFYIIYVLRYIPFVYSNQFLTNKSNPQPRVARVYWLLELESRESSIRFFEQFCRIACSSAAALALRHDGCIGKSARARRRRMNVGEGVCIEGRAKAAIQSLIPSWTFVFVAALFQRLPLFHRLSLTISDLGSAVCNCTRLSCHRSAVSVSRVLHLTMSVEEKVAVLQQKLEAITQAGADQTKAMEYLKALRDSPINLTILTNTRVGMTVNKLRKASADKEVIGLAKTLIRKWKKCLPDDGNDSPVTSSPKSQPERRGNESDSDSGHSNKKAKIESDSSTKPVPTAPAHRHVNASFPPSNTTDSVRIKCRELLFIAIKGDENYPEGSNDPEMLAERLEEEIFKEFKNTDTKYKNRIRSRVANLKDTKNPNLRINFLQGSVSAARLAKMSAEEMASDEMRNIREQFVKDGINDSHLATNEGTKTDTFKCSKCHQRNCTYNQLQTRSADEPMTTFVLCNHCGNRWKFC